MTRIPFDSVVSVTPLDGVARGSGLVIGGAGATPTSAPRMKQRPPNKSAYLSKEMLADS
jgi:hypothetical protein